MNTEKAAFSKSVIDTSMLLNSTRQPIGDFGGGGLNRSVCQLVDWMFFEGIGSSNLSFYAETRTSK
jgi:hypothetical protein